MKSLQISLALGENLRRILLIRLLVLLAVACVLLIPAVNDSLYYLNTLWLIIAGFALFTLLALLRASRDWPVTSAECALQLALDISVFSLAIFLTGGGTNPLISYLLIPVCLAAVSLPPALTITMAVLACTAYSALMFIYVPLQTLEPATMDHGQGAMGRHMVGMWISFVSCALLIVLFLQPMAVALRRQEQEIARRQEQRLHDEQLLAVAGLAAGTAHELGTPLQAMTLLTESIAQHTTDPSIKADLSILDQQLANCRTILRQLTETAGDAELSGPRRYRLGDWYTRLLERWNVLRPAAAIQAVAPDNALLTRTINADATLQQAVLNLLNNACDAGYQATLELVENEGMLAIRVWDEGPEIPPNQRAQLGKPFYSTRDTGLGLGLFVSYRSALHHGGELRYSRTDDRNCFEVRVPLQ